jgi:hypothetical protein
MGMRRSLVRIWLGTTALLILFLILTTFPDLHRAQRFEKAQAVIASLPPTQRLMVLDRIAWLNGEPMMPSVGPMALPGPDQQLKRGIAIAKANMEAARPLPEDLEALVKDANGAPQWARIWWRVGLFTGAIALLWALLYVGFWITSLQRASAPRRSF